MSTVSSQLIFICSFCSKGIRFQSHQLGMRVHCPACQRVVQLFPNQDEVIDERLLTHWYYRQLRLLFGEKEVGPIYDSALLSLIRSGSIDGGTEVRSPQATRNEWVTLARVNVALIQERIDQRIAESQRRERLIEAQRAADKANRDKLRRAIRTSVEDGILTSNEQQAIRQFAATAGIPDVEVQHFLREESAKLAREVFDEAMGDGILDPLEEQRITQLASSLGVPLQLSEEDVRRIDLCRLAYQLDSGSFVPSAFPTLSLKLGATETVLAKADVSWHEVVATKRETVPLGGGRYLKMIGSGTAYVTSKQIVMLSALDSKKITMSSVQRVCRHSDGVFLNRSTGKSVFLAADCRLTDVGRFALITEYACSGQPVLGFDPPSRFVPDVLDAEIEAFEFVEAVDRDDFSSNGASPRYTFRVVGDHIGNRASCISRLRPGLPLWMIREPSNPVDRNAVAVYDQSQNQLGYLKREVAEWFAPILDRGKRYTASVHTLTSSGSLIVAVFD
jgi:tellurite resistance protein